MAPSKTLYHLSLSCDILSDPFLYRAIVLTAFFGFLRISNMAPHISSKFDPCVHFLRQDHIFDTLPGAHLLIKWTKTLQHHKAHHWIQLLSLANQFLGPVRALRSLLTSLSLPPTALLFANNFYLHNQVIDTHIRDALKAVLAHRNISHKGNGFHTLRRTGVTLAFDSNIMGFVEVLLFGVTSKMLLMHPQSYLPHSPS